MIDKMKFLAYAITALVAFTTPVVNGQCVPEPITGAGSTTVFLVADKWAKSYKAKYSCTNNITIESVGTTGGFRRGCGVLQPAVDIANMSRDWKSTEAIPDATKFYEYTCVNDPTRTFIQIPVAIDGIPIIVGKTSNAAKCIAKLPGGGLSVAQLRWIFSNRTDIVQPAGSDGNPDTHLWSELSFTPIPECPATEIVPIGPSLVFGTTDYFREVIFTTSPEGFQKNYIPLIDNSPELNGRIAAETWGIGYYGYAYYTQNTATVTAIPIDTVLPSETTLAGDQYVPLGRRIYMNALKSTIAKTQCLFNYGSSTAGAADVAAVGYLPVPATEFPRLIERVGVCAGIAPAPAPTTPGVPTPGVPSAPTPTAAPPCRIFSLRCGIIRRILGLCKCTK